MKIKRIILSFVTSALVACTTVGSLTVSAARIDTENSTIDAATSAKFNDGPMIEVSDVARGSYRPTEVYNWSSGSYSTYFLPIYGGHRTYTAKMFTTNTGRLKLQYDLYADNNMERQRKVEIFLYKRTESSDGTISYTKVNERTISFNPAAGSTYKGTCTFSGLSTNTNYFIEFHNVTAYGGSYGLSSSDVGVGCNELEITRG